MSLDYIHDYAWIAINEIAFGTHTYLCLNRH